MRQVFEDLRKLLLDQRDVIRSIIPLSQDKREVLLNGESQRLEEIVKKEFSALKKLNAAEKKRADHIILIQNELGLPTATNISISEIAEVASPDERDVLLNLQEELIVALAELTEINKGNQELLIAHFEYTDAMMNLLTEPEDPLNNFYGEDGREVEEKTTSTGFFDSRA